MADADKQIASLPTDEELIKEYRRASLSKKTQPEALRKLGSRRKPTADS